MATGKRIAVVGAGISGLTCAWELQKAGYNVTVYEAAQRVGGRMGTRLQNGFYFDTGTNFFIGQYSHTKALCEELGIGEQWQPMAKGRHGLFRKGKIHWLSLEKSKFFSAFSFLSFVDRLRFILLCLIVRHRFSGTDFFDLSNCPSEMDTTSVYDFARRWGGPEVAELIDGYNATYEFHSSKEISVSVLFAYFGLQLSEPEKFDMWHTAGGEMQVLPNALAKKLTVKLNTEVVAILPEPRRRQIALRQVPRRAGSRSGGTQGITTDYDVIVLATTADATKKIYKNPTAPQRHLLDSVHYSSTITLSFRVPLECVKNLAIITVPNIESKIISSYSNEANKGTIVDGQTLVNVWIWDSVAPELLKESDEEIFEVVGRELRRVCPSLASAAIAPHDLERLPVSMPKYEHGYITRVAEFWRVGQGDNNVWFCGDYVNAPWVEGSVRVGQKVARIISEKLL